MSKFKKSFWITIGVAVLLAVALAATALAAGQGRAGRRAERQNGQAAAQDSAKPQRGERMQAIMDRIVLGDILSISGDTLTVKPELPQELIDRLAEHGVDAPKLPDSVALKVTADSKLMLAGEAAKLGDFKTGDKIVAFCDKDDTGATKTVKRMLDADEARQAMERFREQGGPGGRGGGPGMGMGMGPGGPDMGMGPGGPGMGMGPGGEGGMRERMRPVFGKITKLTDTEVTIQIEIPDFVKERMAERGRELPEDMPSEVTLTYGDRTRFIVNSERVDAMPFKVGDTVAALGIKLDDVLGAAVISDVASAQARMEQVPGGPGEPGMGPGPGPEDGAGQGRRWRNAK